MKIDMKKALLAGTAFVALGVSVVAPTAAQAQIAIETLDTAGASADDNTIDDLTGINFQTDPVIDHDQDATYTFGISVDDGDNGGAANNDVISITTGGANAGIIIGSGFHVQQSDGTGDVITSGDVLIGGGITINGQLSASAATEDAINLSANSNQTIITIAGGAAGDGDVLGVITLGTGGDTVVINGVDGGADLNGSLIGDAAAGGTLQVRADFLFDSTGAGDTIDDISTIDIGDGDVFTISADETIEATNVATVTLTNTESGTGTLDISGGGADVINLGTNTMVLSGSATNTIVLDVDDAATVNGVFQLDTGSVIQSTSNQALTFSATGGATDGITLNGGDLRADVTFDTTDQGTVLVNADTTLNNGATGSITVTSANVVTVGDGVTLTVGSDNTFAHGDADTAAVTFDGTNGGGDDVIDFSGNTITTVVVDLDSDNNGTAGTLTLGANGSFVTDVNSTFDANVDVDGAVSGTLVIVSGDPSGQTLQFNAGSSTTGNVTLTAGADTVNFTGATIGDATSDFVNLGAGDDQLTIDGGTINSSIDGGAGTADSLTLVNNGVTIAGSINNINDIDLGGQTLTLTGTILGLDTAVNNGLDVNGGTLIINGTGSVTGNIHDQAGAGAGGTIQYGADTNGGTFLANGTIDDVGLTITSGTFNTNGNILGGDAALNTSSVATGASFFVNNNVTIDAADTLTNSGTVRVDQSAVLSAGTFAGTGTYTIEIAVDDVNGTPTVDSAYGSFVQTDGAAVDLTGSTFTVELTGDALDVSGGTLTFEDVFTGTGGATAGTVTDTFLLDYELVDDGNSLDLTVSQNNTLVSASQSKATLGTAGALQTIISQNNTTNPELLALSTALQSATTAQEVEDLVESASPTVDGSFIATTLDVGDQSGQIITNRLSSLRGQTGMVTGNGSSGLQAWAETFGSVGDQKARDGIDGYEYDIYGLAVGMDTRNIAEDLTIGLAFSYAHSEADSDNVNNTNTDVDSFFLTAYADYDLGSAYFLEGQIAYGFGDVDQTRYNVGGAGTAALSSFDTDQYQFKASVGRDIPLQNGVLFTPRATTNYVHVAPDNYTESGAGGTGLDTEIDNLDILELGVSFDMSYDYQTNGGMMQPHLSAGYRYDVIDDEVQASSTFIGGGPAFQTEGFDPAEHRFDLGAGFTYFSSNNWEFTADYVYDFRTDFDSHSGVLKAAYNF